MKFSEINKFSKDFKQLSKKYKSLPDDLLEFKKIVSEIPLGSGKHFVVLHDLENIKILKARFFCKYLRGASLRITYAYVKTSTTIHFIELYFKGEQTNEDENRVNEFLHWFNKQQKD